MCPASEGGRGHVRGNTCWDRPLAVRLDAALWAAGEARLRGLRLELVHVAQNFVHAEEERSDEPGWVLLEGTADRLSELVPEVKPSTLLLHGEPSTLLVKEARMVGFAVLGRRDDQDFGELLLGSTAYHFAGHVRCPAVVVPEGQSRPRRLTRGGRRDRWLRP
jgi:Universal stress protein family.